MKIKNVISIVGLFLLGIFNTVNASSLDVGVISQECKDLNGECDVIYISTNNKRSKLLEDYPFKSTVKYHSKYFAEIVSSCGSPCSSSIFIDLKNNKIDRVNMPVDLSLEYSVVVYADSKKLIIKKLFIDNPIYIDVDFSPVSVLKNAIVNVKFLSSSSIELTYLSTAEYIEKIKILDFSL